MNAWTSVFAAAGVNHQGRVNLSRPCVRKLLKARLQRTQIYKKNPMTDRLYTTAVTKNKMSQHNAVQDQQSVSH